MPVAAERNLEPRNRVGRRSADHGAAGLEHTSDWSERQPVLNLAKAYLAGTDKGGSGSNAQGKW